MALPFCYVLYVDLKCLLYLISRRSEAGSGLWTSVWTADLSSDPWSDQKFHPVFPQNCLRLNWPESVWATGQSCLQRCHWPEGIWDPGHLWEQVWAIGWNDLLLGETGLVMQSLKRGDVYSFLCKESARGVSVILWGLGTCYIVDLIAQNLYKA